MRQAQSRTTAHVHLLENGENTMDFRIRQLQCFLKLSDLLNYNKTARTLYLSQPTITFQIKSLEDTLGVKLFIRDRQGVRLTDAGAAFREYAQTIMDTVDSAHKVLSHLHKPLRLRIYCGPVGQFVVLPSVLRALTAQYPEIDLEIVELTTEQQLERLPAGDVDGMLMVGALPIPGSRFDPICDEGLVAIISRQSPLARHKTVSVEDLRETPVIASRLQDCRFHQPFLHALLAPFGITPRIVESPQSCAVQFAYAAAEVGIAIATESMARCSFPEIVARPFQQPFPRVQLGFLSMRENESHALSIFRKISVECAATVLPPHTSLAAATLGPTPPAVISFLGTLAS
jgi:DNA-binding transcriptional LysR family regulator